MQWNRVCVCVSRLHSIYIVRRFSSHVFCSVCMYLEVKNEYACTPAREERPTHRSRRRNIVAPPPPFLIEKAVLFRVDDDDHDHDHDHDDHDRDDHELPKFPDDSFCATSKTTIIDLHRFTYYYCICRYDEWNTRQNKWYSEHDVRYLISELGLHVVLPRLRVYSRCGEERGRFKPHCATT